MIQIIKAEDQKMAKLHQQSQILDEFSNLDIWDLRSKKIDPNNKNKRPDRV